jgi:hypothetical protein
VRPHRPDYKGAELDPERGPGLGCFWFQLIVLAFFIVLIPIGLKLGWPFELLAVLLFVVIGLLLLTGQSVIFLLRLVAADRRAQGRRRPLASPTKTVGEIEDAHRVAHAVGSAPHAVPLPPAAAPVPPAAGDATTGDAGTTGASATVPEAPEPALPEGDGASGTMVRAQAGPGPGEDALEAAAASVADAPEPEKAAAAAPEESAAAPPEDAVAAASVADAPEPEEADAPDPEEADAPDPEEAAVPGVATTTTEARDETVEVAPGSPDGEPAELGQESAPRRRRSARRPTEPAAPPSAQPDQGPEEPDPGVRQ